MKRSFLLFILFLTYSMGLAGNPTSIDSLANTINDTCPIEWEYNCVIKSVDSKVSSISIKMDYNDANGDFFTKLRENARNNREEWIYRLYMISPEWQRLFNQCVADSTNITLLIFSSGGAFSIKIFPAQIVDMKSTKKAQLRSL
ncbi:MAG: hypothetical protein K2H58_01655 [Paramuribaculum sp.]|nr:hypothetical protein [Paramuribaculum sp.]